MHETFPSIPSKYNGMCCHMTQSTASALLMRAVCDELQNGQFILFPTLFHCRAASHITRERHGFNCRRSTYA